jgi:hypothetical protein
VVVAVVLRGTCSTKFECYFKNNLIDFHTELQFFLTAQF